MSATRQRDEMLINTSYFSCISDLMDKHGRSEKNMYKMLVRTKPLGRSKPRWRNGVRRYLLVTGGIV
jgi:hypothetical protein